MVSHPVRCPRCPCAGPVKSIVPVDFLPPTVVAVQPCAYALGAWRLLLAERLAGAPGPWAPLSDPVLAAFLTISRDALMFQVRRQSILLDLAGCIVTPALACGPVVMD